MSPYALPLVGRAGLGNGLFPWARAELFARRTGARILAPAWGRFRPGPYLRGEPEKRRYGGFFRAEDHVHGIQRLLVSTLGWRTRADMEEAASEPTLSFFPCVKVFEGIGELFTPLIADRDFIFDRLWSMTRLPFRPEVVPNGGRFIAMHVRRGDLTRQGIRDQELDRVKQYTPLSWFIGMARAVRRLDSLRDIPVVVFTDGSREEVEALCSIEGVYLHKASAAISDLWTMAGAGALFASGYSTFGMWASFLGRMPTVYAPGKIEQRVQGNDTQSVEIELADGDQLPQRILARFPEEPVR